MIKLAIKCKNDLQTEIYDESFLTSINYCSYRTDGNEIRIGSAAASTLDFTMINRDNRLSGKDFSGCECIYYDDSNNEIDPIGTFYADSVTKNKKSLTFKMSDSMLKFDQMWQGATFPLTVADLLRSICSQCGVGFVYGLDQQQWFDTLITSDQGLAGETCRTILKYIAQFACKNAFINSNDRLDMKYYEFESLGHYAKDVHYGECSTFVLDEGETRRAGLCFIREEHQDLYVGDRNCAYVIDNNPLFAEMTDEMLAVVGEFYVEQFKYTRFIRGEFVFRDTQGIKAGDVFNVYDAQHNMFAAIASKVELKNGTMLSVISEGNSPDMADSTSTAGGGYKKEESFSREIFLGRGQNHQYIEIKGGTFTICEKVVRNVTAFTKVFLNFFANFDYSYSRDKEIYFDIYVNEILSKRLRYDATQGFNQFNAAFLADLDLDREENVFSCRITLEDDEVITIMPFEAQMSFIVKSGKIQDAVATNQYFVEMVAKIPSQKLARDMFDLKTISENYSVAQDMYFKTDLSVNQDKSITATYIKSAATGIGTLTIDGSGKIAGASDYATIPGTSIVEAGGLYNRMNNNNLYYPDQEQLTPSQINEFFSGVNIININGNITEIGTEVFNGRNSNHWYTSLEEVNITPTITKLNNKSLYFDMADNVTLNFTFQNVEEIHGAPFSYNLLANSTSAFDFRKVKKITTPRAFAMSGLNGSFNLSSLIECAKYVFEDCDVEYCRLTPSPAYPSGIDIESFSNCQNFDCVLIVDGAVMSRLQPAFGVSLAYLFLMNTSVKNIVFINDFVVNNEMGVQAMLSLVTNKYTKPKIWYSSSTTNENYLRAIGLMEEYGCASERYVDEQQCINNLLNSYPI